MEVWIVVGGRYEEWFLCGVFSSKQRAAEFLADKEKKQALCKEYEKEYYRLYSEEGMNVD